MSGTITGEWLCKDCFAQISYTATITDTLTAWRNGTRHIKAVVDNDAELRAHAESHGHEGGIQPLVVIVEVAL